MKISLKTSAAAQAAANATGQIHLVGLPVFADRRQSPLLYNLETKRKPGFDRLRQNFSDWELYFPETPTTA